MQNSTARLLCLSLLWMGRFPDFAQLLFYAQSCLDEESARSKGLFLRCLFGLVAALIWILSKPCGLRHMIRN